MNKIKISNLKGFTLIELLVVISIIGVLSSVVMASLSTARERAKVTTVKQLVQQYRNLLELEISDTGTPSRLYVSVWNPVGGTTIAQCNSNMPAGSPYRGQAVAICEQLINLRIHPTSFNLNVGPGTGGMVYTIRSILSTSLWHYFCMNSNGEVTDRGTWGVGGTSTWDQSACGLN
jgi:prepilin-type N-terminal cleavage/methylation domain-containing protein